MSDNDEYHSVHTFTDGVNDKFIVLPSMTIR